MLRIGRKPTVPGIFFALADIGLALFLTSVKTVRINNGVGTTAVRLCRHGWQIVQNGDFLEAD